ncbi:MAG: tetratricopeptide repeat protein [Acidobacteriaceae bacterium]|nr:tetratricopeptide repeat protein [Acidobacteriaceae bacterium]
MSDEAQLLMDGRRLLRRAIRLITETSKIKVWVPLLCSFILTLYYLYTLHAKAEMTVDHPKLITPASSNVAVSASADPVSHASGAAPSGGVSAENDDDNPDIRKRAQEAHRAQQYGDEAKLWQDFMDHSGAPQEACPQIGKAYELAGDVDGSVQAYEKCVSLDGGNVDTLIGFAHVLQQKRDFNRAATLYRQCVSKDPKNLDAQTGLALVALKEGQLSEAQQEAKDILHKAPTSTDALLIAGIVAWREGRLAEAETIFLRGAGLDDRRADFHAFLGRIAEAQRRPQDALRQYDRALALDPNDSEIAERRDRLQDNR